MSAIRPIHTKYLQEEKTKCKLSEKKVAWLHSLQEKKVNALDKWKKDILKETFTDIKEDFDCVWIDNWKK